MRYKKHRIATIVDILRALRENSSAPFLYVPTGELISPRELGKMRLEDIIRKCNCGNLYTTTTNVHKEILKDIYRV